MFSNSETPRVSLLVAMRNEERYIASCLDSILAQEYPADRLEVLVMDGGSTDASGRIVDDMFRDRGNCHLLNNPERSAPHAWNLGIARSTGDVIGIVSGHATLAPDYVAQAVETLQRTGADMVGGPTRAESHGTVGRAIALAMSTPFGVGGTRSRYTDREEDVDTVFMGVCGRGVYERIGTFDVAMVRNQDDEFSYRLRKAGGRIVCNPRIRATYVSRATLRSLRRQYFEYGWYKVLVARRHPAQMRPSHFAPATFIGLLVASLVIALIPGGNRWPLAFLGGTYLVTILMVSTWLALRHGWRLFPPLVGAFATLHFAYGFGFLRGLIRPPDSRPVAA